jgi:hypothetical protein
MIKIIAEGHNVDSESVHNSDNIIIQLFLALEQEMKSIKVKFNNE